MQFSLNSFLIKAKSGVEDSVNFIFEKEDPFYFAFSSKNLSGVRKKLSRLVSVCSCWVLAFFGKVEINPIRPISAFIRKDNPEISVVTGPLFCKLSYAQAFLF